MAFESVVCTSGASTKDRKGPNFGTVGENNYVLKIILRGLSKNETLASFLGPDPFFRSKLNPGLSGHLD